MSAIIASVYRRSIVGFHSRRQHCRVTDNRHVKQDEKAEVPKSTEELPFPLHKVFVDLSLENDLKGEELEWFKSKISPQIVEKKKKKKKEIPESRKLEIVFEHKLEKPIDKPNKLILRLTETETIWFLSLGTYFSEENVEDAERVRRENENYEKKKRKKEIIRKRCMADAQTPRYMVKSKGTLTTEIVMEEAEMFASEWDLYDTYNTFGKCEMVPTNKLQKVSNISENKTSSKVVIPTTEQVTQTFASSNFKYASLVTERLLASNCYQTKQSIYKKDFRTRYYTGPTEFSYKMEPLWSFQKELPQSLTITAMDWNPLNQDLLTVGYGDLNFEKGCLGMVCVWSSKNPRQPERQLQLEDSVTSLHYSRSRPNILAVGARSGIVYVVDVSVQYKKIRVLGSEDLKPHPGPVWKVEWFLYRQLDVEIEELLAVGESGVLMVLSTSIDKDTKDLLKLEYVTTSRKVWDKISAKKLYRRIPFHDEIFDKKTYSGLSFSIRSERNYCYISTKEGAVIKCSLLNPSMTDGVFLAHDGPIYTIQHSPATDVVFLTCGADWKIKIWMEGVPQPLITLQQKAPVTCARWSPTIPTLIASVGQDELSLWDIGRNVLNPMSVRKFEDCGKSFSNILFSSNGANLILGCEEGQVRVVHLSELPRIPFLQKEALISAIRRILVRNKTNLYEKFRRAVEAHKDKLQTNIIENLKKS